MRTSRGVGSTEFGAWERENIGKMKRICLYATVVVAAFMSFLGSSWAEPDKDAKVNCPQPRIIIQCGLKTLQLWCGAKLVRTYPIETARTGLGKRRSGDGKTPIGDYRISWMASRVSKKGHRIIPRRSWCKNNRFVYASTGPPLEKLWAEEYGGEHATVMSLNYPNEHDRAKGRTGTCLHIHADNRTDQGKLLKSYGCIHMFPKDAIELYELVEVGTPVRIRR